MRRLALACPALPTCGLAIAEAERVSPHLITEFEALLDDVGLAGEPIVGADDRLSERLRAPYVAEIAFVGRSKDKYTVYLGGSFDGDRLAAEFLDLVHVDELVPVLAPGPAGLPRSPARGRGVSAITCTASVWTICAR